MNPGGAEPLESLESIQFEDLFEVAEIQRLQDAFAEATGVASLITRVDGTPITRPSRFCRLCLAIRKTKAGLENCMRSDAVLGRVNPAGPILQRCLSGGLYDAGTALSVGDRHIGNWLVGQVLDETFDPEQIVRYVREVGGDPMEAREALAEVTRMSPRRFEEVCQLHFLMAQQLSRLAWQNLCAQREIAARRKVEAEREQLQRALLQAQKMEAIGRLAGGVAHDFNNILTGISGCAELALHTLPPGAAAREELGEIRRGLERATELTRQLLTFSRRRAVQPEVINLNEVLGRSQKLLARTLSEDVVLRFSFAPDLASCRVDPGLVEQVLLNLAVNARDAMEGGGTLEVSTSNVEAAARPQDPPRPTVCLRVTDTGCGMDEETQRHLFEPFFTTKPPGRGTGLGLATVYGIVQQHGGFVAVQSRPGHGTTFSVHFPRVDDEPAPGVPEPGPAPAPRSEGSGRTVLVVEDDPTVRQLLERSLYTLGYRVLAVASPRQAVALAAQPEPRLDLLVTDLVMPELSGREVCREVLSRHPETLVLLISGYADDRFGRQGSLDARLPFLAKPFTVQELAAKVREVLEKRAAVPWDALVDPPEPRRP